ncbi:MAG: hypothetical protein ACQESR_21365 [Planctomycetota bacterium]
MNELRMSRWIWRLVLCAAVSGVLLTSSARMALAQRPGAPKLLPKMTLAYVRVADSGELVDAFMQTSMGRLGRDNQIRPLVTQLYGSAAQAFSESQEQLGVSLDELLSIPRGGVCAALVGREQGKPALAFLVDAGGNMPAARKLLDACVRQAEQNGQRARTEQVKDVEVTVLNDFAFCDRDDTLLLSSSPELIKEVLRVWDGEHEEMETLADNPTFTTVTRPSVGTRDARPEISWFVDPINLIDQVTRDNDGAQIAIAMLPLLGLDGIKAAGGSIILPTKEFDSISHLHVLLDSPREGILKMVALEAGEVTPEDWVPRDAASYMTVNWDLQQTFDELETLLDGFRGEGSFQDMIQRRFSDRLGIDFQQEVLDQFDDRVTHVRWFEKPARINSGTNLFGIKLKDAEAFEDTLDAILAQAGDRAAKKSHQDITYHELTPPRNQRQSERVLVRRPTPCLGIVGDHLLASDSVKCLQAAISAKRSPADSFSDQLDFKLIASRIEQELGAREPAMIRFQRPEESMRSFYELATSPTTRRRLNEIAQDNRVFRILNDALRENPLPPFSAIAKYLAPSGGMLTSDPSGLHYTGFSFKRE